MSPGFSLHLLALCWLCSPSRITHSVIGEPLAASPLRHPHIVKSQQKNKNNNKTKTIIAPCSIPSEGCDWPITHLWRRGGGKEVLWPAWPGLKIHPLEQVLRSAELSKYILDGRKNSVHYAIFTPNSTILPQYLRGIGSIGSRTLTAYPNLQVLKFLMWNSVVFAYNLHISFCIL